MPKINWKRAYLLFAAVWLSSVAAYFWHDVTYGYMKAEIAHGEHNRDLREAKFQECMRVNNLNWFAHWQKYHSECRSQAERGCNGDRLCPEEKYTDECLKSKIPACSQYAMLSAGDGTELGMDGTAFRKKEERDQLFFYWQRGFSSPLKTGLLVAFIPLLVLPIVPLVAMRLWRWLTTGKK